MLDWKHVAILAIGAVLLAAVMFLAFKYQNGALIVVLGAVVAQFLTTIVALFTAKPGATQTTSITLKEPAPPDAP